jgi:hypothetical protein
VKCARCSAQATRLVSHLGGMGWEPCVELLCARHAHRASGGLHGPEATLRASLVAILEASQLTLTASELRSALAALGREETAAGVSSALGALWLQDRIKKLRTSPLTWRALE